MTLWEFEQTIWRLEAIRVVVRDKLDAHVDGYPYSNAANRRWTVTTWLNNRVRAQLNDQEVVVIGGDGEVLHGGTQLINVRNSYTGRTD